MHVAVLIGVPFKKMMLVLAQRGTDVKKLLLSIR